jgi:hypothetical protein
MSSELSGCLNEAGSYGEDAAHPHQAGKKEAIKPFRASTPLTKITSTTSIP